MLDQQKVEHLLLLEKLLVKFEEDVEAGRVRMSIGDLARILVMKDGADTQEPRTVEVRWIGEGGEKESGESDMSR